MKHITFDFKIDGEAIVNDTDEFLKDYKDSLTTSLQDDGWPQVITETYVFESCLKHKGGKEVYLVIDKRTGEKAILRATSNDSGERADAEGEILSLLQHPSIPRSLGVFRDATRSYIVREYIPGQPLDLVVSQGTLPSNDIYQVARKLCTILGYLHSLDPPVVHRDLKPQNIILKPDGTLVLTDFGIARTFKPGVDSDTEYVGTLPYAPPEQYGYAQSTPQTDIYALGIVLIYLATGGPNRQDLQRRITDKRLRALIEKCIAFDPKDRFASVDQVLSFVDKAQSQPKKLLAGLSAGVVLLILVGVGSWFVVSQLIADKQPVDDPPVDAPATITQADPPKSPDPSDPLFDSEVTGNISGNIHNGGFAVETNDAIYITEGNKLYVMDLSGENKQEVTEAKGAACLNFYKGYLYYGTDKGIFRLDPKTDTVMQVSEEAADRIYFTDDRIYFEDSYGDLLVKSIALDGSDLKTHTEKPNLYISFGEGYLFYSDQFDAWKVHRIDLATGEDIVIFDDAIYYVYVYNSSLYFTVYAVDGGLLQTGLDGSAPVSISFETFSSLCPTPQGILAGSSTKNNPLELISYDGESRLILLKSGCGKFCVASDWIIYQNKDDNDKLWMLRLDGSENRVF
ncbi:MAG: DUF5050 domain-containing protein [Coriobacteriales bacterium]|jgi:serine/threonine protein kinase|nr:DUF5050 domain-containing protein [Coriobacteriales bacterium]